MDVQATPLSSQSLMVVWSPPPLYTLHGILQGYKVLYKPVRADEGEIGNKPSNSKYCCLKTSSRRIFLINYI